MIGKSFPDNDELADALAGKRITEINSIEHHKSEYVGFGENGLFIEAYLPMRTAYPERKVAGVVEFYKFPTELNATIEGARRLIWLTGLVAALVVYVTLYWIVQRGAKVIESQQRQLGNMQSAALIGELASAVAHSLRNPMAGIRSSAELWRAELAPENRGIADDVIHEVDKMNEYVRDLLDYAHSDTARRRVIDPAQALQVVLNRRAGALRRNKIMVRTQDQRHGEAQVSVDPVMFEHALTSIINNAIEAMPDGGKLDVSIYAATSSGDLVIEIADAGPGIPAELIGQVTESWFTTKSKGLGLGLALARNMIERWGGKLTIGSAPGSGTVVSIVLQKA
jgi:two-component system sensor histidine kinase HydH